MKLYENMTLRERVESILFENFPYMADMEAREKLIQHATDDIILEVKVGL